jgi:hypothetical protein
MTNKILFLILFIVMHSIHVFSQDTDCIRKNIPVLYGLDGWQLKLWRCDSNGCWGNRSVYVYEVLKKEKNIIGMPKALFFILFGNPDRYNHKDELYSYYSDAKCDGNNKHLDDSGFKIIVFEFVDGKLFSIGVAVT